MKQGSATLVSMASDNVYLASREIVDYVRSVTVQEPPVLVHCREETASHPRAVMQIAAEQGQLFRVLLAALNAKKTLEIGVFTGYSSTVTALALPADGRVIACDISDEYTREARRYWKEAGVTDKIELRLGPAAQTLEQLHHEGHAGTFDFAFIDADKTGYDRYYELSLPLVRQGGMIMFDNMLRGGRVLNRDTGDPDIQAIQDLNVKLGRDPRVVVALLAVADGITLAVKK